jgi:hypothetical protein
MLGCHGARGVPARRRDVLRRGRRVLAARQGRERHEEGRAGGGQARPIPGRACAVGHSDLIRCF